MDGLTQWIREKAAELGLSKIGIAPADALADEGRRLKDWLGLGFHGEMAWMEREPDKRSDPRALFPNAKTVIAAAVNYFTPHRHAGDPGSGKISRYAWGDEIGRAHV